MSNYQHLLDRYSIITFRTTLINAVNKYSYSIIAKESGVARSTLHRIIKGDYADISLSTAHKIMVAIVKLKKIEKI